jgi:hypothetical protein
MHPIMESIHSAQMTSKVCCIWFGFFFFNGANIGSVPCLLFFVDFLPGFVLRPPPCLISNTHTNKNTQRSRVSLILLFGV